MSESAENPHHPPGEHCGIFTIPPPIPILGAWRDISYEPVRDNIWTVSEGIYRSIFLEGRKGTIAFDTLTTPGTARAYAGAVGRVFPGKRLKPAPRNRRGVQVDKGASIRGSIKHLFHPFGK